jgi:hypothetical protein
MRMNTAQLDAEFWCSLTKRSIFRWARESLEVVWSTRSSRSSSMLFESWEGKGFVNHLFDHVNPSLTTLFGKRRQKGNSTREKDERVLLEHFPTHNLRLLS